MAKTSFSVCSLQTNDKLNFNFPFCLFQCFDGSATSIFNPSKACCILETVTKMYKCCNQFDEKKTKMKEFFRLNFANGTRVRDSGLFQFCRAEILFFVFTALGLGKNNEANELNIERKKIRKIEFNDEFVGSSLAQSHTQKFDAKLFVATRSES